MKKIISQIATFVLLLNLLFSVSPAYADTEESFTDANLKAAIHSWLGVPVTTTVYQSDLATKLASNGGNLDLSFKNITSLDGMEIFNGLPITYLDISVNTNITDITPLAGLSSIIHFEARGLDQLWDLSPLANLTNLQHLALNGMVAAGSPISLNLAPISNLTNLKKLYLGSKNITDISALTNLNNLTDLSLTTNAFSNLTALQNKNVLTNLDLSFNNITSLTGIKDLSAIVMVDLMYNQVGTLPSFNFPQLSQMDLRHNNISSLAPLVVSTFKNTGTLMLNSSINVSNNSLSGQTRLNDIPALNLVLSNLWWTQSSNKTITSFTFPNEIVSSVINGTNIYSVVDSTTNISSVVPVIQHDGLNAEVTQDVILFSPISTSVDFTNIGNSAIYMIYDDFSASQGYTARVGKRGNITTQYIDESNNQVIQQVTSPDYYVFPTVDPPGANYVQANNAYTANAPVIPGYSFAHNAHNALVTMDAIQFQDAVPNAIIKFYYTPAVTLTSLTVSPATSIIQVGQTQQYTATANFSDGSTQNVTNTATWNVIDTSKASIGSTGLASGLASGSTNITATWNAQTGTANLTVTAVPIVLNSITVTPATSTIQVGQTQQYTATANFSDGSTQNVTNTATWNVIDTSKASIGSTGLASGLAAGSTNITATWNAQTGTANLTVTAVPTPQPAQTPGLIITTAVPSSQPTPSPIAIATPTPTDKPIVTPVLTPSPTPLPTQKPEDKYGRIYGVIHDITGKPLSNILIEIHSEPQVTLSNDKGEYFFEKVELGKHTVILKDAKSLLELGSINIQVDEQTLKNKTQANISLTDEAREKKVDFILILPDPEKPKVPQTGDGSLAARKSNMESYFLLVILLVMFLVSKRVARKKHQ